MKKHLVLTVSLAFAALISVQAQELGAQPAPAEKTEKVKKETPAPTEQTDKMKKEAPAPGEQTEKNKSQAGKTNQGQARSNEVRSDRAKQRANNDAVHAKKGHGKDHGKGHEKGGKKKELSDKEKEAIKAKMAKDKNKDDKDKNAKSKRAPQKSKDQPVPEKAPEKGKPGRPTTGGDKPDSQEQKG